MQLIQENGVSRIVIPMPVTADTAQRLCELISNVGQSEAHTLVLDMARVPYMTIGALQKVFQYYAPLYERSFKLIIDQANNDVLSLLQLANFQAIAQFSHKKAA